MPNKNDHTTRSIQLIQQSLLGLAKGLGALAPLLRAQDRVEASPRRTLNLSPKVRAFRKLQGTYMGYVRQLKPGQRARVKALRAAKGYPAAVKLAKSLAAG